VWHDSTGEYKTKVLDSWTWRRGASACCCAEIIAGTVVVNHSAQAYKATISTSLPVKSVRQIGADSSKALPIEGPTWKMDLEPYEAAIVEWK
jgi:hypothetical protein